MRVPVTLVTTCLLLTRSAIAQAPPVRDISFAADGRLAASIEGDLWVRTGANGWRRVTSGPAWDRFPAWSPDGQSLVFTSNRDGQDDLYRLRLAGPGAPERITTDPLPDHEPTVAADGTILFVRGRLNEARLWQRSPTGAETRVTTGTTPERAPHVAPDGKRFAYVQQFDGGRRVRLRSLGATTDSVVTAERPADDLAWSPDGTRLVLSTTAGRGAVYWTPTDGRFVNYLAPARGDVAWTPDGRSILVAERSSDESGYNGDPDRVGDRRASEVLRPNERLLSIAAPAALAEVAPVVVAAVADRAARNTEAFDRFAARMRRTYYDAPGAEVRRGAWDRVVAQLRPRAVAATTDQALETVMHEAIAARPTLRDEANGRAGVSSAHPVSTAAGVEILQKGGNVVDAAVAVSFALGVVEPDASGMGGYGEMLVYLKGMPQPRLLEFMARVPEEAGLGNASLMEGGRYPSDGPVLAMVPGTVAAMHTAWKRHGSGKVAWADLLAPAIRAARDGYAVSDGLATTLWLERDRFAKYESSRALFFRDGKPRVAGDTIRNPDLAWTLEQVAQRGADGFYRGRVAERLVNDLRGKGNAIRLTDLSRYFAADREPVATTYRGFQVFGSTPPVSGGATLAAQLNALEQVNGVKAYPDDAASLHAMITAWQLVPSSRNRIADPSLWPVDVTPFTSKDTARTRWRCFDAAKALTPTAFRGDTLSCATTPRATPAGTPGPEEDAEPIITTEPCNVQEHARMADCRAQGTTSFVVADGEGNAVAVTQTLGTWGGNFYVTPGLGFLYNDKLTSYGTDPNAYGARIPFARHGSTISPTIVLTGEGAEKRAAFTVGAAGNAWINSAVYQSLVGMIDAGLSPQRALELPRFLPSQRGAAGTAPVGAREYVIDIEDGIHPEVMSKLRSMGHTFNLISLKGELRMGYGAAIAIGGGSVRVGADPRRSGTAGAVP